MYCRCHTAIARFRKDGAEQARPFRSPGEAYEFLRHFAETGDIDVTLITSPDGDMILSPAGFHEISRLDRRLREGWLGVLARAVAEGHRVGSP
jgi:hypothetical protein